MAQRTTALQIGQSAQDKLEPILFYEQKASTTIPAGTLAMQVQGSGNGAEPYVANTNNAILLGVAQATYVESTGSNYTRPNKQPMVFLRGVFTQFSPDGTITDDDIGCTVYLKSNWEFGNVQAGNDCEAIYLGRDATGNQGTIYRLLITKSGPM